MMIGLVYSVSDLLLSKEGLLALQSLLSTPLVIPPRCEHCWYRDSNLDFYLIFGPLFTSYICPQVGQLLAKRLKTIHKFYPTDRKNCVKHFFYSFEIYTVLSWKNVHSYFQWFRYVLNAESIVQTEWSLPVVLKHQDT